MLDWDCAFSFPGAGFYLIAIQENFLIIGKSIFLNAEKSESNINVIIFVLLSWRVITGSVATS
jgi:hypothetical protein